MSHGCKQENEVPKHRKRRGGRKPFSIEYRNKPGPDGKRMFGSAWRTFKRYKTERSRDEALRALEGGGIGWAVVRGENIFEYRKV